jgi:ribose transport system substrate-binding protein
MMKNRKTRGKGKLYLATGILCVLALVGTACSSSTAASSTSTTAVSGKSAGLTRAEKQLAPYVGHPTPFPVTEKLDKLPPRSSNIVFLECAAGPCANFGKLMAAPIAELGIHLTIISSGLFPSQAQAAAESALALHPAAVIVAGTALSQFGGTLTALEKAGTPVFGIGVDNGTQYGLSATLGSQVTVALAGQLMADWVLIHKGPSAHVVYFGAPELDFSPVMSNGFDAELKNVCPKCTVSLSQLSVLTYGSTSPGLVVSYLRDNPSVNTLVFSSESGADGLPSALTEAGLNPTTFGFAPDTINLGDIKAGTLNGGGLGLDSLSEVWSLMDIIAKTLTHQSYPASETVAVTEVLNQSNVNDYDVQNGWSGYPDAPAMMKKLWP